MVPEACWAVNHLAVLLLWCSRLATITSPREFDPTLTSHCTHHHTSNLPTNGANCRVSVFGPDPLQWICREWIQRLGSDRVSAYLGIMEGDQVGVKNIELYGPMSLGERTPRPRTWTPSSSCFPRASLHLFFSLFWEISAIIYPFSLSSSSYTC